MSVLPLFARVDTERLYPPVLLAVSEMLAELQREGSEFWVVSGYRTEVEQMHLWTQGRTRHGPIVTHARALESAHNFGLAVDLCRDSRVDRTGLQPSWRMSEYAVLDRACRLHGLEWGGWWRSPDYPHVQLAGYVTARGLAPLADVWRAASGQPDLARLQAVWEYLDDSTPQVPPPT